RPIAEQRLEGSLILRRGDDQYLADARKNEHREGIIDHRLVIDRHELLGDRAGERIEPRSRAAGEDDPLAHRFPIPPPIMDIRMDPALPSCPAVRCKSRMAVEPEVFR